MEDGDEFCKELREKTKVIHDESDKLVNLKLAIALTDKVTYGKVLLDFYHVFLTIESCLEECKNHPCVGPLIFHELTRSTAFEKDLAFYLGEKWRQLQPSTSATEYCDRILEVTKEEPTLLIAYAHSMYLALLAGGQMIRRIVKRTLGLDNESGGLDIFTFSANKQQIKKQFMDNINNMKLERAMKDQILIEKARVFKMNNKIASNVKPSLKSSQRLLKIAAILLLILLVIFYVILRYLGAF